MINNLFKKVDGITKYIAVLVTLVISLYAFLPDVIGKSSPVSIKEVEILLKEHDSFTQSKYADRMNSLYHPNFTMTAIHSSGKKEIFNKAQLLKHHEFMNEALQYSINTISKEISLISDSQALVTIISEQKSKAGLIDDVDTLYQSMIVSNDNGKLTFLKVISIAQKNNLTNRSKSLQPQ